MTGGPGHPERRRGRSAIGRAGLVALLALAGLTVVALVTTWPPSPRAGSAAGPSTAPSPTPSSPAPSSTPPAPVATLIPEPLEPCPRRGDPVQVSVLTFNIHGGLGDGGYHLETIADEVEQWDADVVLLQEVDRHRERTQLADQSLWLSQRLDRYSAWAPNVVSAAVEEGGRPQEYGTLVLSRWPVFDTSHVLLPHREGLEQRGLMRATVDVGGTRIDVYNTHLDHTSGQVRREQTRAIVEEVSRRSLPVVLGGDLNAEPDSPALRLLRQAGLEDSWPSAGDDDGLTVPAGNPRRRIDFVLHDRRFRAVGATTRQSAISDHRAVQVDLSLRRPRSCG